MIMHRRALQVKHILYILYIIVPKEAPRSCADRSVHGSARFRTELTFIRFWIMITYFHE